MRKSIVPFADNIPSLIYVAKGWMPFYAIYIYIHNGVLYDFEWESRYKIAEQSMCRERGTFVCRVTYCELCTTTAGSGCRGAGRWWQSIWWQSSAPHPAIIRIRTARTQTSIRRHHQEPVKRRSGKEIGLSRGSARSTKGSRRSQKCIFSQKKRRQKGKILSGGECVGPRRTSESSTARFIITVEFDWRERRQLGIWIHYHMDRPTTGGK